MNLPDDIFVSSGNLSIARRLHERASVRLENVDVALLYDNFTPTVLTQIEDCGFYEGGAFVESGSIRFKGGLIPVNTHGGQLSQACIIGMPHIAEAVEQ